MMSELFRKWFGLESPTCLTCEVLRLSLEKSESERRELLTRLLERDKPEPVSTNEQKELKPITSQFVPWRVRQQMLEREDAEHARLLRAKKLEMSNETTNKSINELEQELGIEVEK